MPDACLKVNIAKYHMHSFKRIVCKLNACMQLHETDFINAQSVGDHYNEDTQTNLGCALNRVKHSILVFSHEG